MSHDDTSQMIGATVTIDFASYERLDADEFDNQLLPGRGVPLAFVDRVTP